MRYNITFHTDAGMEYVEAYKWYEQQRQGLGSRFEGEVENVLQKIAANPYTYHTASGSFREAIVDVFPFVIVYKVKRSKQMVFISAIYHTSRNPKSKYRK